MTSISKLRLALLLLGIEQLLQSSTHLLFVLTDEVRFSWIWRLVLLSRAHLRVVIRHLLVSAQDLCLTEFGVLITYSSYSLSHPCDEIVQLWRWIVFFSFVYVSLLDIVLLIFHEVWWK